MARRRRESFKVADIYHPGRLTASTAEFIKMWLKPFAHQLSEAFRTDNKILTAFFHTNTRDVYFARCHEQFKMPGELYIAGARLEEGTGKRRIFPGDLFIFCVDEELDYVKVEVVRTEEVFKVDLGQFNFIKQKTRKL